MRLPATERAGKGGLLSCFSPLNSHRVLSSVYKQIIQVMEPAGCLAVRWLARVLTALEPAAGSPATDLGSGRCLECGGVIRCGGWAALCCPPPSPKGLWWAWAHSDHTAQGEQEAHPGAPRPHATAGLPARVQVGGPLRALKKVFWMRVEGLTAVCFCVF